MKSKFISLNVKDVIKAIILTFITALLTVFIRSYKPEPFLPGNH
jgi:hypothetical protein